jgi:hypothetical protein
LEKNFDMPAMSGVFSKFDFPAHTSGVDDTFDALALQFSGGRTISVYWVAKLTVSSTRDELRSLPPKTPANPLPKAHIVCRFYFNPLQNRLHTHRQPEIGRGLPLREPRTAVRLLE